MGTDQIIARIDQLDHKMDRLFRDLLKFLSREVAPGSSSAAAVAASALQEHQTLSAKSNAYETSNGQTSEGVKVFRIEVDSDGNFQYDPKYWGGRYASGDRVQWVSPTGRFKIQVNRYGDMASPFGDEYEITSKRNEGQKRWETQPIRIQSVFSEAERLARRLANAPPVNHRYTVVLTKDEEIFIDTDNQSGGTC